MKKMIFSLLLILCFAVPPKAMAAISIVQTINEASSEIGSITLGTGSLLVLCEFSEGGTATVPTDDKSSTWTEVAHAVTGGSVTYMFYLANADPGITDIQSHVTGGGGPNEIALWVLSGATLNSVVLGGEMVSGNYTNTSSISHPTIPLSIDRPNSAIIIACYGDPVNGPHTAATPDAGWTIRFETPAFYKIGLYQLLSFGNPGTYTPGFTSNASTRYSGVAAWFLDP